MTEEEKKEFEEFLQWKREKAAKAQAEAEGANKEAGGYSKSETECNQPQSELKETAGRKGSSWPIVIIIGFVALVVLVLIFGRRDPMDEVLAPTELGELATLDNDATLPATEDVQASAAVPEVVTWNFTTQMDEMTDTKNIWARIVSDNYISQDFPYEGETRASITVRYMKKYGYDVLIYISQGQIDGREYYGTDYITARFDEGTPIKFYFNESNDGSSDVVFIRNSSDFIKRCKQARDIKIDIPIYQSGRPVFTFHVDEPLVWPEE